MKDPVFEPRSQVSAVHEQSGRTVEIWSSLLGFTMVRGNGDLSDYGALMPIVSTRLSLFIIQALVHRPGARLLQSDEAKQSASFGRFLLPGCDKTFLKTFHYALSCLSAEIKEWSAGQRKSGADPLVMLDPKELECAVTV